jgi:excisionase family DNA binding protein
VTAPATVVVLTAAELEHYLERAARKGAETALESVTLDDDVLTMDEACELVKMGSEAMRRHAAKGRFGAFKVGRDWRFKRRALLRGV